MSANIAIAATQWVDVCSAVLQAVITAGCVQLDASMSVTSRARLVCQAGNVVKGRL